MVRWLPEHLFTHDEYQKCHLLYYTGITRTAKGILAEIVRGMFLNSTEHLNLLGQMKQHAIDLYDAIQRNSFEEMGRLIRKTWQQNQALDSGTNPNSVAAITQQIDDLCLGYNFQEPEAVAIYTWLPKTLKPPCVFVKYLPRTRQTTVPVL